MGSVECMQLSEACRLNLELIWTVTLTQLRTHTHACTHTHTHTRARTLTHARTHAHSRTHARTHARTHTHTHTHTHTAQSPWLLVMICMYQQCAAGIKVQLLTIIHHLSHCQITFCTVTVRAFVAFYIYIFIYWSMVFSWKIYCW